MKMPELQEALDACYLQNMETFTIRQIENCFQLKRRLEMTFQKLSRYEWTYVDDNTSHFIGLTTNVTNVKQAIRRWRVEKGKFLALNDQMVNDNSAERMNVGLYISKFLKSMFPQKSEFER